MYPKQTGMWTPWTGRSRPYIIASCIKDFEKEGERTIGMVTKTDLLHLLHGSSNREGRDA